ncbi:unnamed protein product [Caenorhabditis angaria]|uniref:Uncharacterized protein n=1 Tax=Caenorhabditis angaria TaxID=860376 RepID=A0A9P1IRA4_9PELO|nr:unnamed protein product [Caenorhabditis angaria]
MLFYLLIGVQRFIVILNFEKTSKYVQGKYLTRILILIMFLKYTHNIMGAIGCSDKFCTLYSIIAQDFECRRAFKLEHNSLLYSYLNLATDIVIPTISFIIYIVLLKTIHKNQHILSETRRKSELAIIHQNLPIFYLFMIRIIGVLLFYMVQTSDEYLQYIIGSLTCRTITVSDLFPVTYIIANFKRLRDMMPCKFLKNQVYVAPLSTIAS